MEPMNEANPQTEETDQMEGLKTEWNKKAILIAKDGTTEMTINLPPFCPDELTVNDKRYRAGNKTDGTIVFHEVTE